MPTYKPETILFYFKALQMIIDTTEHKRWRPCISPGFSSIQYWAWEEQEISSFENVNIQTECKDLSKYECNVEQSHGHNDI